MTPVIPSPLAVLLIAVWFAALCSVPQRRTVEERRIKQVVHWSELE